MRCSMSIDSIYLLINNPSFPVAWREDRPHVLASFTTTTTNNNTGEQQQQKHATHMCVHTFSQNTTHWK